MSQIGRTSSGVDVAKSEALAAGDAAANGSEKLSNAELFAPEAFDERGSSRRRYVAVVEKILASIGSGRLSVGDRLPNERELAEICQTSRPTIRDALLALELFGVVEVRQGSGCYVTRQGASRSTRSPVMLDSPPRELLEAREHVEPVVAALCASRVRTSEVARLAGLIDECEAEGRKRPADLDRFLQLSHGFHSALAGSCGNSILSDMTRQLVDVASHPLWMLVNGMHVREEQARNLQIAEHREILDAIARRDSAGAHEAMVAHLGGLSGRIFGSATDGAAEIRRRRRRSG